MEAVQDEDLRNLYRRIPGGPVARGDLVDGQEIEAFVLVRRPFSRSRDERAALKGGNLIFVPPRTDTPTGPSPVTSLDRGQLRRADAELNRRFGRELGRLRRDGKAVTAVLKGIRAAGHHVWLVGGFVREVERAGPDARIKDLDFAGTAGGGTLGTVLTRGSVVRQLRRDGCGHYRYQVSGQGVWSMRRHGARGRLMEYKALAIPGKRPVTWGGDLRDDAGTRDLTVNTLLFDPEHNVVIDPTGRGRADVRAAPPVLSTPLQDDDAVQQAIVVFRCLKFLGRWRDARTEPVRDWLAALPADLVARISDQGWEDVLRSRRNCVVGVGLAEVDEDAFAAQLGEAAVALVKESRERYAAWPHGR